MIPIKLITELTSNQQQGSNVEEIKIGINSTLNSPPEIAKAFSGHFTNIGPNLVSEIPA